MPAVTRKGDADVTHCSTPFRLGCSEDVFVNNVGCGRIGDGITACTSVAQGSPDVFAGG